jgi:transposase
VLAARDAELAAIEADLDHWYTHGPFVDAVTRLAVYRGIARLGALTIASEVGDWRRFPTARSFMRFTGLVPSEYSSGASVHRGHITKAGNAQLRTARGGRSSCHDQRHPICRWSDGRSDAERLETSSAIAAVDGARGAH